MSAAVWSSADAHASTLPPPPSIPAFARITTRPPAMVIKRCGCNATYTQSQWATLAHVGFQHFDYADGESETFDCRNCPACRSTLVLAVPR